MKWHFRNGVVVKSAGERRLRKYIWGGVGEGRIGRGGTSVFTIGPLEPFPLWPAKKISHRAKMQNIMCKCAKKLQFLGTSSPNPLPELCPWSTLGNFRSPSCHRYIKWQWLLFLQLQRAKLPEDQVPEARIHSWLEHSVRWKGRKGAFWVLCEKE